MVLCVREKKENKKEMESVFLLKGPQAFNWANIALLRCRIYRSGKMKVGIFVINGKPRG